MSSLDQIKTWKKDGLKHFCRTKGLRIGGSKDDLIARVFSTVEHNLTDVLNLQEKIELKAHSYSELLRINGILEKDPFLIDDGWLDEKNGICKWPPTMHMDICKYMIQLSGN